MIDATWQDDQITLLKPDPDPVVSFTPDIEVTRSVQNVPDLLIFMQMLVEERLDLFLVNITHLLWAYCDLIPVLVVAGCGNLVNTRNVGNAVVDDSQLFQVVWVD